MTAKKKKGGKAELKRKCESTKLPNSNKQNHHQKQTNRNLKEKAVKQPNKFQFSIAFLCFHSKPKDLRPIRGSLFGDLVGMVPIPSIG
jgi:hypothetical protein